jgi:hypothetical protein
MYIYVHTHTQIYICMETVQTIQLVCNLVYMFLSSSDPYLNMTSKESCDLTMHICHL